MKTADSGVRVKIGASDKGNGHGSVYLELQDLGHSRQSNYPEGYFTETFAMFYVNFEQNQLFGQKAPKTYNFIKQLD